MSSLELRKVVTHSEEVHREGGRAAEPPLNLHGVAAVITNPWAGPDFTEDLRPLILEVAPELGEKELGLPVLQVSAAWDAAIPPAAAELTKAKCSDVEVNLIEECGHWTQLEKPEELTRIMVDWLVRRFGEGSP